ncbi:MAG: hypothetical protein ACTSUE_07420 [Promethearchaeota archaeon]
MKRKERTECDDECGLEKRQRDTPCPINESPLMKDLKNLSEWMFENIGNTENSIPLLMLADAMNKVEGVLSENMN